MKMRSAPVRFGTYWNNLIRPFAAITMPITIAPTPVKVMVPGVELRADRSARRLNSALRASAFRRAIAALLQISRTPKAAHTTPIRTGTISNLTYLVGNIEIVPGFNNGTLQATFDNPKKNWKALLPPRSMVRTAPTGPSARRGKAT